MSWVKACWSRPSRLLDHVQVGVGDALAEAFREGQQEQDHLVLLAGVEAADHAEVHERQAAVVGQQDVARVRIAVEHAVDGDLLHVRRQQVGGDGLRIVLLRAPSRVTLRPGGARARS